jgi:NADPH-dependent curcumin reductase CurA
MPTREAWAYREEPVRDLKPGEVLIKVLLVSLDPAMRGWMRDQRSYSPPIAIGEVMRALALGKVVISANPKFPAGKYVSGPLGVQEYCISDAKSLMEVDPRIAPLPKFVSVLGMTGMTAYFGLLETGQPVAGETVVVSAAAGAVGSIVGQIAKIKGCRAVGIAGGDEKCRYLTRDLGFDAAVDYKSEKVADALRTTCPAGINVYFDNVGGDILEAALANLARGARIVICGAISQYNNTSPIQGPRNYLSLLVNRASMKGMLVFDYAARYPEAVREMAAWLAADKLKSREDIVDGLETFPETFVKLFTGDNFGKLILRVADDESVAAA